MVPKQGKFEIQREISKRLQNPEERIILLEAASGYGKTTILAQIARQCPTPHWLDCGAQHASSTDFLNALMALFPSTQLPKTHALDEFAAPQNRALALATDLNRLEEPPHIFLDNALVLPQETLETFASALIEGTVVYISTYPNIFNDSAFPDLLLAGQMQRITQNNIAFTDQEILAFGLEPNTVQHLHGQAIALAFERQGAKTGINRFYEKLLGRIPTEWIEGLEFLSPLECWDTDALAWAKLPSNTVEEMQALGFPFSGDLPHTTLRDYLYKRLSNDAAQAEKNLLELAEWLMKNKRCLQAIEVLKKTNSGEKLNAALIEACTPLFWDGDYRLVAKLCEMAVEPMPDTLAIYNYESIFFLGDFNAAKLAIQKISPKHRHLEFDESLLLIVEKKFEEAEEKLFSGRGKYIESRGNYHAHTQTLIELNRFRGTPEKTKTLFEESYSDAIYLAEDAWQSKFVDHAYIGVAAAFNDWLGLSTKLDDLLAAENILSSNMLGVVFVLAAERAHARDEDYQGFLNRGAIAFEKAPTTAPPLYLSASMIASQRNQMDLAMSLGAKAIEAANRAGDPTIPAEAWLLELEYEAGILDIQTAKNKLDEMAKLAKCPREHAHVALAKTKILTIPLAEEFVAAFSWPSIKQLALSRCPTLQAEYKRSVAEFGGFWQMRTPEPQNSWTKRIGLETLGRRRFLIDQQPNTNFGARVQAFDLFAYLAFFGSVASNDIGQVIGSDSRRSAENALRAVRTVLAEHFGLPDTSTLMFRSGRYYLENASAIQTDAKNAIDGNFEDLNSIKFLPDSDLPWVQQLQREILENAKKHYRKQTKPKIPNDVLESLIADGDPDFLGFLKQIGCITESHYKTLFS